LFTSDTNKCEKKFGKTALIYLIVSVFCALFGCVYETFSHGVYSFYMIYAFLFPLVGGTLPFLIFSLLESKKEPQSLAAKLYHSGIAALTVGSIVKGILEIYGTTNRLTVFYWIFGVGLVTVGVGLEVTARLYAFRHRAD